MSFLQTAKGPVEIRELRSVAEMSAAETIQVKVWGKDEVPTPKEILIPMQHEGGLVAGAFNPAGEMVGLVFGFPTGGPAAQHSHLLATLAEWRGQKIGAALKWFQRDWCLERGIQTVRWTVDPLRAANAELNIRNLGATSSTYYVNYYGAMEGIDAGVPTDRLLVEWRLNSPRVAACQPSAPQDRGYPGAFPANRVEQGQPAAVAIDWNQPEVLLRIPEGFIQLAQANPALANAWRLHTRAIFQEAFARGFEIDGFTRVGGPAYHLQRKAVS